MLDANCPFQMIVFIVAVLLIVALLSNLPVLNLQSQSVSLQCIASDVSVQVLLNCYFLASICIA